MKKREDKRKEVESLRKELERVDHLFVAGFEKLKVGQDFQLRKIVRSAGGRYKVIKNNLAAKAAEGTKAEDLMKGLAGMTSLAYTAADPVALAKVLTAYAKENPTFQFKAGMVEGRVIDVRTVGELASLPSREEMFGKLLYLIQTPAQRLVSAINGVGRKLAVVVDQACQENKFTA
ncbi:MAG TPA: 50S ribosomal protein L10 [Bryobacteraceae bacterium]|nr:50S ribosomal protein L10 [Bryobacteraceae bacterium]